MVFCLIQIHGNFKFLVLMIFFSIKFNNSYYLGKYVLSSISCIMVETMSGTSNFSSLSSEKSICLLSHLHQLWGKSQLTYFCLLVRLVYIFHHRIELCEKVWKHPSFAHMPLSFCHFMMASI